MRRVADKIVHIIFAAAFLAGCSQVGLCTKTSTASLLSPSGRYQVELISADCVGAPKAKWVVLHNLDGWLKGQKIVAIFGDDGADSSVDVKWIDDKHLAIRAQNAKAWSFQPNWHDVSIIDQ